MRWPATKRFMTYPMPCCVVRPGERVRWAWTVRCAICGLQHFLWTTDREERAYQGPIVYVLVIMLGWRLDSIERLRCDRPICPACQRTAAA